MIKLVLIGGGHSHAIFLKLWGLNPLKNVQVILISDVAQTPYSGMLPGYLAGFYSFAETHIDLIQLAQFAQAELILDKAIALDLAQNQVHCLTQGKINFDYLAIDIGSTPKLDPISGIENVIPAKPVPGLLRAWEKCLNQVKNNPKKPVHLTVVGGGIGGVELALNMRSRLTSLMQESSHLAKIILIHRHQQLLNHFPLGVSQCLKQNLANAQIHCLLNDTVKSIESLDNKNYQVACQSGVTFTTHLIIWVTQASPASWIKTSGLATDEQGFILVNNTLRSPSHPHIFATGDIASIVNQPRPKAGVFAVRQGKPLFENIRLVLQGQEPKGYTPQKTYLSLIGTGNQSAIAVWGNFYGQSPLFWQWKDQIDRKFMAQFC